MSLLELASSDHFGCTQVVIAVERGAARDEVEDVTRNLHWVGFELSLLEGWVAGAAGGVSERWLFLSMEL